MEESKDNSLDRALSALPREVLPERDLWAGIRAQIDQEQQPAVRRTTPWLRLAAGFVLVVASSLTTYLLMHQGDDEKILQAQREAQMHQPAVAAMPVSFGGQLTLGQEYLSARAVLDAQFQLEIEKLPPVARARLERNLADLRRAANEISATLAEHPSHPLLQELLLSTYQNELALLGGVTGMSVPTLGGQASETRL